MSNQEQLVAEIAQEVIARLRLHLRRQCPGGEQTEAGPAGMPAATASSRPWTRR